MTYSSLFFYFSCSCLKNILPLHVEELIKKCLITTGKCEDLCNGEGEREVGEDETTQLFFFPLKKKKDNWTQAHTSSTTPVGIFHTPVPWKMPLFSWTTSTCQKEIDYLNQQHIRTRWLSRRKSNEGSAKRKNCFWW